MPSSRQEAGAAGRASAPTSHLDHDILIIGSGPAGSSTALHLARVAPHLLPRTLVLEKGRHPRPKLCAGGLLPDVDRCLARLDLDVRDVRNIEVQDLELHFEGRGFNLRLYDHFAFRVIRRDEFDGWLADKARSRGATIQEDTRVRKIERRSDHVEVHTDRGVLRARVVVGADGSNSVVRHAVAPRNGGAGVGRSLEVFTPGASPRFPTAACGPLDAYFEFGRIAEGNAGYVYNFPTLGQGVSRQRHFGAWDCRVQGGIPAGSLTPMVEEEMSRNGFDLAEHKLSGFPVRWYQPGAPLSAPSVLLAGDAAGVCTLFGEGISIAIGYGQLVANELARAFRTGDFSFADYTATVAKSALGRSLWRRWALASTIYRLESRAAHRVIWRHGGPVLGAIMKRYVFNWSK